jgi:hypothetical protein
MNLEIHKISKNRMEAPSFVNFLLSIAYPEIECYPHIGKKSNSPEQFINDDQCYPTTTAAATTTVTTTATTAAAAARTTTDGAAKNFFRPGMEKTCEKMI